MINYLFFIGKIKKMPECDFFRSDNEFIVVADVIYPEKQKKNYTRYNLTNLQKCTIENLSKTRLVWHIVNSYVKNNNNNSLDFNKLRCKESDIAMTTVLNSTGLYSLFSVFSIVASCFTLPS